MTAVAGSAAALGRTQELRGAHVLVAGAGISGRAAAVALVRLGARVTITDARPDALVDLPEGTRAGPERLPADTALVVTGPGRRPDDALVRAAALAGCPVVGEPELAWWIGRAAPVPAPWLAVTGTNGKTTTVGMLEAMLRAAGLDAVACGNIGHPVVAAVTEGRDVLAVELSSFQLYWSPSVVPAVGCVLNVAEDHLDWHGSMAAYAAAKGRALRGPVAVAGVDDPAAAALLAAAPAARRVGVTLAAPGPDQLGVLGGALVDRAFGGGELVDAAAVVPAGPSGVTDALAAAALALAARVPPSAVAAGLAAFRPAGHRGAVVATVDGVTWVDDSKATNPHAARAALTAVAEKVVWIVGGLLKGASVDALVAESAPRLRAVVVIGTDRTPITAAMRRHAPDVPVVEVPPGDDGAMAARTSAAATPGTGADPVRSPVMSPVMSAAVRAAAAAARPGDTVLLAPAAASMDQFTDYAARGRAFAAAVDAMAVRTGERP